MGYGAERAYEHVTHKHPDGRALKWLRRFGAKACLLSWLPVVGDPLCAVAGWLKLPFWPCVAYMAWPYRPCSADRLTHEQPELAAGGEVKGDTTTLEDFTVIAKLKEQDEG